MKQFALIVLGSLLLAGASLPVYAGPVNINTADAATLAMELNGVGPVLAQAIVEDRAQNGRYESPEDLTRVSGIGSRIIENNREFILVDD
jgi:competence protein ComEA